VIKARIAVSLVALAGSITAWGQEGTNGIGGSLRVSSEETDNALKTPADEVSERQDTISAGAVAIYENDLMALDSRYSLSNNRYSEDSQEERTSILGSTQLRLGKDHHLVELLMSHSRQKVLASAELVDLEENNDERQILLVQPMLHTSRDSADVLFIQGNMTEVDYRFDETRNSSRTGGAAGWQRALSPVDNIGLVANFTDVEFDTAPQANYQMQMFTFNYGVKLRRLSYTIDLGHSSTEAESGDDHSAPYYSGQLNFDTGYNEYSLSASQKMSDSSFGAGSIDIDGGEAPPGDTGSPNQEQMLVRLVEAGWVTAALCERCSVSVHVVGSEREYLGVKREERSVGATIGLSYQLSNAATFGIRANRREQKFAQVEAENRENFTLNDVNVYYNYQFANGISARLLLSQEEQTSEDLAREYDELRAGISLAYTFK